MALIHCPECNHEVSDSALTCPNCGFVLKKEQPAAETVPAPSDPSKNYFAPDGTRVSDYETNTALCVAWGIALLVCIPATFIGFVKAVIPGVMMLLLDALIIMQIRRNFSGHRMVVCPYCGKSIEDVKSETGGVAIKCTACKKTASFRGDFLKPIE